ncbi:hypothetical protein AVEN_172718-1 [Araneus ventricosus]|uniref:Uncharacterized protein n=1 Tax=Araneus ventricosus TaxID=182803 RepID=A0A4Y2UYA1_ARAVE|nr:hypothetical protein AVEN_172718-1 [Araneus ventricosus]
MRPQQEQAFSIWLSDKKARLTALKYESKISLQVSANLGDLGVCSKKVPTCHRNSQHRFSGPCDTDTGSEIPVLSPKPFRLGWEALPSGKGPTR